MVKRVVPKEVELMYTLYEKYGTYAAVAREIHRSPNTVAKYLKARGLKPLSMSMASKARRD